MNLTEHFTLEEMTASDYISKGGTRNERTRYTTVGGYRL